MGASLGLALKQVKLNNTEIIGTDGDRDAVATAAKMGVVDESTRNLGSAMEGANLVIVTAPTIETREILEAIGPILEPGCVVTDTGTAKAPVMEWADEYLPSGIGFIGGHPLPKRLPPTLKEADPSLFQGIDYVVIPAKSADGHAVRTVTAMVERLGAKPLFLDPHEHDSYAAAMSHLPVVLSSAFVTATAGSDGWREMHRLASSEFSEVSRLASEDPIDNEAACRASPDALVHWIDQLIAELYSYRNQIKDDSSEFLDGLVKAWEALARWEAGTVVEQGGPSMPSAGDTMAQMMLGSRLSDRYKQMTKDDKGDASIYRRKR